MNPKIKNIIIFVVIAVALVLVYVFFLKPAPAEPNLTSSTGDAVLPVTNATDQGNTANEDFLPLLLNVKNIKLDDKIFIDQSFNTLHDSSILLTPDGTEGRPNPFAPIGNDILSTTTTDTTINTGTTNGLGILGTVAPIDQVCDLKLSVMGIDPLLNVTLLKGVNSQITALGFKGLESKVSWSIKDIKIATVSSATGKTVQLKSIAKGSTELIVKDNEINNCSVAIPVTIN